MSLAIPQAQRDSLRLYLQPPRIRVKLRGSLWPTHLWVREVQTRRPAGLYLAATLTLLVLLLGGIGFARWRR